MNSRSNNLYRYFKRIASLSVYVLTLTVACQKSSFAQFGSRVYLRYEQPDSADYEGLRIRTATDRSFYWLLGRRFVSPGSFPQGVPSPTALAQVAPGGAGVVHKHFQESATSIPFVGIPSDFWVNNGTPMADNSVTISALRWYGYPSQQSDLSLFSVDQNLNLAPAASVDYFEPFVPRRDALPGSSLVYDPFPEPTRYVIAWNNYPKFNEPGNLSDWGIMSVDASNLTNVVWKNDLDYAGPNYLHESMTDMCLVSAAKGNRYAVCGLRRDVVNNRYGGLITMVDNAGNIVWQNVYNPPVGSGLRVEFNCVTTQAGGAFDDLVVTGTIRSTNPLVPSSILWLSLSPNTGAINWSSRYMLTNGDDCEAFHHSEIVIASKNIVCAGRITHKSDGHTSAMLMEIIDRLHHQGLTCDSQVVWWRYYDTRDRKDSNDTLVFLNTELRDVVPIINGEIHDVAAIGTAERFHNGVRIKDLLWMETATNTSVSPPVYGLNSHDSTVCRDSFPQWTCEDFPLDIEELKPILLPKIKIDETGLTDVQDLEYKVCETLLPSLKYIHTDAEYHLGELKQSKNLSIADPWTASNNGGVSEDVVTSRVLRSDERVIDFHGMYSCLGKCVASGCPNPLSFTELEQMIAGRELPPGIYFCLVRYKNVLRCIKTSIP